MIKSILHTAMKNKMYLYIFKSKNVSAFNPV